MASHPGYSLTLVTPPATEPVTDAVIRQQCRFPENDDNYELFTIWGAAARKMIEDETQVRFITQTIKLSLPYFPSDGVIRIPVEPVASITHLKYYDVAGTLQTLTPSTDYLTELARKPPVVYRNPLGVFPPTQTGRLDAVQLTFVAGYGGVSDVPAQAKQAILLCCSFWNSNRGDDPAFTDVPGRLGLPSGAIRLIRMMNARGYS